MPLSAEAARLAMVREQIAARNIDNPRILEAMRKVPRHAFLPGLSLEDAYADRPQQIGWHQTISQPYMVAAMTALLDPQPGETILEIGTGSGYQSAVLAELAGRVISIERHAGLAENATKTLAALGYRNVEVHHGDGTQGWAAAAPYAAILVTAGAPHIPAALSEQLALGGRLVIPVGIRERQQLLRMRKDRAGLHHEVAFECIFVPLVGADAWPE